MWAAGWGPFAPEKEVSTAPSPTPAQVCLSAERVDQGRVTRVTGIRRTYRISAVPHGHTYDLRGATIVGSPTTSRYPMTLGKYGTGRGTCVLGGRVIGQQSRAHTWHTMKERLDGDGLNIRSPGGVVEGFRVDNVEDGIATVGGDPAGITISNVRMTYIRDDCIENDWIVHVTVRDSLFDGCYTAISQRPDPHPSLQPAPAGETMTLDGVLIRLQPMPYDLARAKRPGNAIGGLASSGFFKWSPWANKLVVKNTILMAERTSVNGPRIMDFPTNAEYENVTLVWLGPGDYQGRLPPSGVTVTTDRRVWDEARASWLARHPSVATSP